MALEVEEKFYSLKVTHDEISILYFALHYYNHQRHTFANAIAKNDYIKSNGEKPILDEVNAAMDYVLAH